MARILLVDDDPDAAELIAEALQDEHHVAHIASSAELAIQVLNSDKMDAVVTDLRMPGLDGAKFVRFLRSHPRHSRVPVIMISGLPTHHELAGEVDAFLQKPFRMARLTELLRELLADRVG